MTTVRKNSEQCTLINFPFSETLFSLSSPPLSPNTHNKKKLSKCSRFIEDLEKCGGQSSAHGWSHGWGTPSIPKRVYWLTITAISFGALIYFIKLRVTDFMNADVATSFSFEHPEEKNLPLPHLTICSLNSVDDTYFYEKILPMKEDIAKKLYKVSKANPNETHAELKNLLWRRLTKKPRFQDVQATTHNRFYYTTTVGAEIGIEEYLHGTAEIECLQGGMSGFSGPKWQTSG